MHSVQEGTPTNAPSKVRFPQAYCKSGPAVTCSASKVVTVKEVLFEQPKSSTTVYVNTSLEGAVVGTINID